MIANRIWWFGRGFKAGLQIDSGGLDEVCGDCLRAVLRIESGGFEVVWKWFESRLANRIWLFGGRLESIANRI